VVFFQRSLQPDIMIKIQTAYEAEPDALKSPSGSNAWHRGRSLTLSLNPDAIDKLDLLASLSNMSRHKYALCILQQALGRDIVLKQEIKLSREIVGSVTLDS